MTVADAVEKLREHKRQFGEIEVNGELRGEHLYAVWHSRNWPTRAREGSLYLPTEANSASRPKLGYVNLIDDLFFWAPAHHKSGREEEFSERMASAVTAFRKLAREAGQVISRMPQLIAVVSPIACGSSRSAIQVELEMWWFAALFRECSEPIQEHDYNDGGPEFETKLSCSVCAASEIVCDTFIELLNRREQKLVEHNLVCENHDAERPAIYISYAWGDDESDGGRQRGEIVERLCTRLDDWGYEVIRDTRNVNNGDLISAFMKRIGRSNHVLVILSAKYLRSVNCMTELCYIYSGALGDKDEFLRRVIPVVLNDAEIYQSTDRAEHARYWRLSADSLKAHFATGDLGTEDFSLYQRMRNWHNSLADTLAFISDKRHPGGFDAIAKDDFSPVREMLPQV